MNREGAPSSGAISGARNGRGRSGSVKRRRITASCAGRESEQDAEGVEAGEEGDLVREQGAADDEPDGDTAAATIACGDTSVRRLRRPKWAAAAGAPRASAPTG